MSITFNAFEIFEIAEQIERNGLKFYRKAAEFVSDKDVRQMLLDLADMEAEHEETFANMRKQISHKQRDLITFDLDNEVALYLQALASGHVFDLKKDTSRQLTGKKSVEDIINMAVQAEKDSIAYYVGMEKFVPASAGKKKVEEIIAEEMKHIVVLSEKRATLK